MPRHRGRSTGRSEDACPPHAPQAPGRRSRSPDEQERLRRLAGAVKCSVRALDVLLSASGAPLALAIELCLRNNTDKGLSPVGIHVHRSPLFSSFRLKLPDPLMPFGSAKVDLKLNIVREGSDCPIIEKIPESFNVDVFFKKEEDPKLRLRKPLRFPLDIRSCLKLAMEVRRSNDPRPLLDVVLVRPKGGAWGRSGTTSLVRSFQVLLSHEKGLVGSLPVRGHGHDGEPTTLEGACYPLRRAGLQLWDMQAITADDESTGTGGVLRASTLLTEIQTCLAKSGSACTRPALLVLVIAYGAPSRVVEAMYRPVREVQARWQLQPLAIVTHADRAASEEELSTYLEGLSTTLDLPASRFVSTVNYTDETHHEPRLDRMAAKVLERVQREARAAASASFLPVERGPVAGAAAAAEEEAEPMPAAAAAAAVRGDEGAGGASSAASNVGGPLQNPLHAFARPPAMPPVGDEEEDWVVVPAGGTGASGEAVYVPPEAQWRQPQLTPWATLDGEGGRIGGVGDSSLVQDRVRILDFTPFRPLWGGAATMRPFLRHGADDDDVGSVSSETTVQDGEWGSGDAVSEATETSSQATDLDLWDDSDSGSLSD